MREHEPRPAAPAADLAPARLTTKRAQGPVRHLLALQEGVGNAATARALRPPGRRPAAMLQRVLSIDGKHVDPGYFETIAARATVRRMLPPARRDMADAVVEYLRKEALSGWDAGHPASSTGAPDHAGLARAVEAALRALGDEPVEAVPEAREVKAEEPVDGPPVTASPALAADSIGKRMRAIADDLGMPGEDDPRSDRWFSFCLELNPDDMEAQATGPGRDVLALYLADTKAYTSCHSFAAQLTSLLTRADGGPVTKRKVDFGGADSKVPKRRRVSVLDQQIDGIADDVAKAASSGERWACRIKYGIHSFTAVTRAGKVEILQSFAGPDGYSAAEGIAMDLVLDPGEFAATLRAALGPGSTGKRKRANEKLFGGFIDEGHPNIPLEYERRPLAPEREIQAQISNRLERNLKVIQELEGAASGRKRARSTGREASTRSGAAAAASDSSTSEPRTKKPRGDR